MFYLFIVDMFCNDCDTSFKEYLVGLE